jgi:hypothetical protein
MFLVFVAIFRSHKHFIFSYLLNCFCAEAYEKWLAIKYLVRYLFPYQTVSYFRKGTMYLGHLNKC